AETSFRRMREVWFGRLLGPERDDRPKSFHMSWVRRLSPLESTYTKERATEICLDTLKRLGLDLASDPNIRTDVDDRPQQSPPACVARALLRPVRRAGRAERGGDRLPRSTPLQAVRREAAVRARVLVTLRSVGRRR